MKLFNLYLIVGGMPGAVNAYVTTHNLKKVSIKGRRVYDEHQMFGFCDKLEWVDINDNFFHMNKYLLPM